MMKKIIPITIAGVLLLSACGNDTDKKGETVTEKAKTVEKKKETPKQKENKKDTVKQENSTDTQNEQQDNTQVQQTQQESTPQNYETYYNQDGEFYNSLTDEEFEQMKRNAKTLNEIMEEEESQSSQPSQWVQDQIDWANSSEAERVEKQKEIAEENGVEYNPEDFQP
ncbi:hypothetical protein [Staphylococcus pseudintermedius]|uniref:hypothetical protein n=1 Tax=Staphylococcus pseudintermedius TaxID=283734 RepID=UPI0018F6D7B2|nr:hypothetical protein [Staphylococcus pseudintermedius]MBJ8320354.1 hypothetical protein [Staphylococcus pseudintermedius]